MGKLLMLFCMLTVFAAAGIGAEAELADAADQPDEQELFGYPEGPVRDWPDDQQRRVTDEVLSLFEPMLIAVGFEDAERRAFPYIKWVQNRLNQFAERNVPSRNSFVAAYFPQDIAERYADSQVPEVFYWTWMTMVLGYHWGQDYRIVFDPEQGMLDLEAEEGRLRYQAGLRLPPLALRAVADALRQDILVGLPEMKEGYSAYRSLGDSEWSPVEIIRYSTEGRWIPSRTHLQAPLINQSRLQQERQRIHQLEEPALPIAWHDDWDYAFETARAENRPVMVFFSWRGSQTEWFDDVTFRDPDVVDLTEHTVNLRLDQTENAELYSEHKVSHRPQVHFRKPDGELIATLRGFTFASDLADAQRKVLSGEFSLQLYLERFAASPNDPSIAADLLKFFSEFIEPDEKLRALDVVCEAVRNGNQDIISRYESYPDWLFFERVVTLLNNRRWQEAYNATESDTMYLMNENVRGRMRRIRLICLYTLGRGEEAQRLTMEIVQAQGLRESPFWWDFWHMIEITDWP